ncbi:hypothetical protein GPECTOR_10g840 [Gonium pectorale]|uniref:Uncharacterized protein n=1 Tax=Gonium pectorale TaxID=33097 RepID=A0A150GQU5_GONPE|nr:hypothetical protein GPECTOR_10g840 [Gonium pectorale]|eukprot:KXZ52209.1 hypothetical protein GPECTOR_10g840 [Gonium pectorale]
MRQTPMQFYDTQDPKQSALADDLHYFPFAVGEELRRIFNQVASCADEQDNLLAALRTETGNRNLTELKCPARFHTAQRVVMLWLCSPSGGGFLNRLRERHRPTCGQWTRGAEKAVLEEMTRVSPTLAERLRVIAWEGCTEEQKAVALEQYLGRLTDPAHHLEVLRRVMEGNMAAVEIATNIIKSMPTEAKEAMKILQTAPKSLALTGWQTSGAAASVKPGQTLLDMFPGELIHALTNAEASNRGREEAVYQCATGLRGAVPGLLPALQQALARKPTGVALQIAIEMLSRDQGRLLLLGAGVVEVVSKLSNESALELLSAQCLPALLADLEAKFKPPVRWGTATEGVMLSYVKQNISPTLGTLMQRTAWEGCTRQQLRVALKAQLEQAEPSVIRCFIDSAPTAEEREMRRRLVAVRARDIVDAAQDLEAALPEPVAEPTKTATARGPAASGPETGSGKQQELPPSDAVDPVGTQAESAIAYGDGGEGPAVGQLLSEGSEGDARRAMEVLRDLADADWDTDANSSEALRVIREVQLSPQYGLMLMQGGLNQEEERVLSNISAAYQLELRALRMDLTVLGRLAGFVINRLYWHLADQEGEGCEVLWRHMQSQLPTLSERVRQTMISRRTSDDDDVLPAGEDKREPTPTYAVVRAPATNNGSSTLVRSFNEEEGSLDGSTALGSSSPAPQQELEGDEPQPAKADAACGFPEWEPLQPDPFAGAQAHRHAEMAMELLAHLEAVERDKQRWAQRLSPEMLVMMTAELLRSPTWGMPEWSEAHLDFGMKYDLVTRLPIMADEEHQGACLEAAEQASLAGCREHLRARFRRQPGPLRRLAVAPAVSLLRAELEKVLADGGPDALVERCRRFAFELPTLWQKIRI